MRAYRVWTTPGYDVAEICLNGHLSNSKTINYPHHCRPYCEKCGEATITACPSCHKQIRGYYHVPGFYGSRDIDTPSFCLNCGKAFPWTERKQQAAIDLFLEESMDESDRKEFRQSIEQIAKDTPQAQVASKRINRLLGKIGKETASAIRDIIVDMVGEAAKKMLMP